MQTRIYNGPHPEVQIPLVEPIEDGDGNQTFTIDATKGEPVKLRDELAARLDEQGESWLHPDGESQDTKTVLPGLIAEAKAAGLTVPEGAVKADVDLLLAEHEQSNGEPVAPPEPTPLEDLKRAELDEIAREKGVENPDKLGSKAAVVKAIEAALQEAGDGDNGSAADEQNQPGGDAEQTASGGKE